MNRTPLTVGVRRAIRRRGLLQPEDRVIAAVSGGADSLALAHLLAEIQPERGWQFVGLVHVNHGLRPGEADEDEAFCRGLAERLRLPLHRVYVDVRQRAAERRQSLEAAARDVRYAAFEEAAAALSATHVATGHTLDDQAETVLLRLLRGAATRGVGAIRARRGAVIRPLLDVPHADLCAYLTARGESWRTDSSNADLRIPRNRLRHTVMPLIRDAWPGGTRALARFADLSLDDEMCLQGMAAEVFSALAILRGGGVQLDVRGVGELPAALARRVVRQAIESAGGRPSFADVEAVRRLARSGKREGHLDLAHVAVERDATVIRVAAPAGVRGAASRPFYWPMPVPGATDIPETGVSILASLKKEAAARQLLSDQTAVLQARAVRLPLAVRSRRPGDRIRPLGAPGARKLQDLLVDRKVPRRERDRVPIVIDAEGRILWVAGIAIAHDCRVTAPQSGVVILELKKDLQ
jgi:tRNA(Ile)-lysidine synthase